MKRFKKTLQTLSWFLIGTGRRSIQINPSNGALIIGTQLATSVAVVTSSNHMTIVYKVQGYDLTTSTLTTVLTIDSSSRAIVKEITLANDTVASTEVNLYVTR
jgi:hypothetical protein